MDISLGRDRDFSWSTTGSRRGPRWAPAAQRYLRVFVVVALYGVAVFVIHGLATDFRAHGAASSADMGMCHRR